MDSREIVRRAIEFDTPPRLPFFLGGSWSDSGRELVEHWSTPQGGFIVFNYGDSQGIGVEDRIAEVMFKAFYDLRTYWSSNT